MYLPGYVVYIYIICYCLVERVDAEHGEEVQSLADMTDTENVPETVEQVVQYLFPRGK